MAREAGCNAVLKPRRIIGRAAVIYPGVQLARHPAGQPDRQEQCGHRVVVADGEGKRIDYPPIAPMNSD